jgi:hypothetical protein
MTLPWEGLIGKRSVVREISTRGIIPDFAFGCKQTLYALLTALSITLIMVMEVFLNRSVKKLNLAALED